MLPKKSVASRGICAGMLSIEHTRTPSPAKLKHKQNSSHIKLGHSGNDVAISHSLFLRRVFSRVVQSEGMVNGRALFHELNRTTFISGNVANSHHPMRQVRTSAAAGQPGHGFRLEEGFGIGNRDEARSSRRPVDAVDETGSEWCDLFVKF